MNAKAWKEIWTAAAVGACGLHGKSNYDRT